jgi:hypothetical protein
MKETIIESALLPKKRIVLRNLTAQQKKELLAGSISVAALLTGGGLYYHLGGDNAPTAIDPIEPVAPVAAEAPAANSHEIPKHAAAPAAQQVSTATETLVLETNLPFSGATNDNMSFDEAFAAARTEIGPGGFFEYRGCTHPTYTQDEWSSLSPAQQDAFTQDMAESVDILDVELVDNHTIGQPQLAEEPAAAAYVATPVAANPVTPSTPTSQPDPVETPAPAPALSDAEQSTSSTTTPGEAVTLDVDISGDGEIDALAIDATGDDFVDMIAYDSDGNGLADQYMMNLDGDETMDVLILDPSEDGINDNEEIVELEDEMSISMDDLRTIGDQHASAQDEELNGLLAGEDLSGLPDMENDVPMDDMLFES